MAMLVATFETSYNKLKDTLHERDVKLRCVSRTLAFHLMTWGNPILPTRDGYFQKEMDKPTFMVIIQALIEDLCDIDAPSVEPMLLFPNWHPVSEDKLHIKSAVGVHLEQVAGAVFVQVDTNDG